MFGRHFGRRRDGPWQGMETQRTEFEGRGDWHKREFADHLHHWWHGHRPHHGWREDAPFWFGPRDHDRFDRFFGRGGPFGGDPFDEDGGGRQRHRRGDIKYVLLELLAEQPRHGYELIKELEQRYAGFYRPSPGSVYPTLQLLEEEGRLTSEQSDGKRIYTITESGRQLLAEYQSRGGTEGGSARRHGFRMGGAGPEMQELGRSVQALMAGMVQVARHGTPAQIRAATTLLDTARREMYAILAQNDVDEPS